MDSPSPAPKKDATMKIIIGVVIAFAVLMVGCRMMSRTVSEKMIEKMIENGGGGNADVDINNGSMTFTNDEGTVTTGNSLPDDWPSDLPSYPGATIQFSGTASPTAGESGMAAMMTTKDDAAKVVAFYKAAMGDNGWKIQSTMQAQGSTILIGAKDKRTASIAIAGDDDQTAITLGVQTK